MHILDSSRLFYNKYNYICYFVKFIYMLVIVLYFVITSVFEISTLETKTAYRAKAPLGRLLR